MSTKAELMAQIRKSAVRIMKREGWSTELLPGLLESIAADEQEIPVDLDYTGRVDSRQAKLLHEPSACDRHGGESSGFPPLLRLRGDA